MQNHSNECNHAHNEYLERLRAWTDRWPDHCETCNGEGGRSYGGDFFDPGGFDPCPDCQEGDNLRCPRCGTKGETWDEATEECVPCKVCGWTHDRPDHAPEGPDCCGDCVDHTHI